MSRSAPHAVQRSSMVSGIRLGILSAFPLSVRVASQRRACCTWAWAPVGPIANDPDPESRPMAGPYWPAQLRMVPTPLARSIGGALELVTFIMKVLVGQAALFGRDVNAAGARGNRPGSGHPVVVGAGDRAPILGCVLEGDGGGLRGREGHREVGELGSRVATDHRHIADVQDGSHRGLVVAEDRALSHLPADDAG